MPPRNCEDCKDKWQAICFCSNCAQLLCESCKEKHHALNHGLTNIGRQEVGPSKGKRNFESIQFSYNSIFAVCDCMNVLCYV